MVWLCYCGCVIVVVLLWLCYCGCVIVVVVVVVVVVVQIVVVVVLTRCNRRRVRPGRDETLILTEIVVCAVWYQEV